VFFMSIMHGGILLLELYFISGYCLPLSFSVAVYEL
jgi:hypothetical protein